MKTKILKSGLLFGIVLTLLSFDMPTGWIIAGSKPKSYEMGIDKCAGQNGKNAATIKSKSKKVKGFGTLMQMCLPSKFLGKRVRMTGMLKTKDVSEWSGLWFRIDQNASTISIDNMHDGKVDRSVKGTTDWASYDIVLDVPLIASRLAYGALLLGKGQIWFDNISFEVVDNSVPVTSSDKYSHNAEPVNLDFEN